MGNKSKAGGLNYASQSKVTFYVADMFTGLKALAMTQIPYHNWNGIDAKSFSNYFKTITDAAGRNYGNRHAELFEDMEYDLGRGWFVNLTDGFYVSEAGSVKNVNVRITPESQKDGIFLKKLTSAAYVNTNNKTVSDSVDAGAKIGTRKVKAYVSPFTVSMDGVNTTMGQFNGSGPISIGIASPDYGYVVGDVVTSTEGYYNEYGITNEAGGYYHPQLIENTNYSKTLNKTGFNTIVPSGRIVDNNNPLTNYYYPLQINQINNESGEKQFRGKTDSNFLGCTGIRKSTTATETALNFFAGAPELVLTNKSSGKRPLSLRTNRDDFSVEPRTGLSRMVSQAEDFFYALSKDKETSPYVTVKNSAKNAIYSFNINLLVSPEQENVNYRTSRITLEFIFSIQALQPTFTWKTSTPTNPGRWLVFDNAKVQIYGEGYSTGDYTTNPTDSVTMSGGSIYRKVTINN
jgi:hypothetical protein|tara:strand:- start:18014 stop:19396 length:1383 start_codon:yes stop_codon:yes gene_type:complete